MNPDSMIRGWKPYTSDTSDGIVTCPVDDPECTVWEVVGPGSPHWSPINCDSLYRAQRLKAAFVSAFNAGRAARAQELRDFINGAGL